MARIDAIKIIIGNQLFQTGHKYFLIAVYEPIPTEFILFLGH